MDTVYNSGKVDREILWEDEHGNSLWTVKDYDDEKGRENLFDLPLEVHPEIVVWGRVCKQKRCVGFFSDVSEGYRYSNRMMEAQPLTPILSNMVKKVNKDFDLDYNGVLVNLYSIGLEYIYY